MDLSFTAEEEAFAAEIREWLRANLGPPSDDLEWGRRWQAKLAADRWVGVIESRNLAVSRGAEWGRGWGPGKDRLGGPVLRGPALRLK